MARTQSHLGQVFVILAYFPPAHAEMNELNRQQSEKGPPFQITGRGAKLFLTRRESALAGRWVYGNKAPVYRCVK